MRYIEVGGVRLSVVGLGTWQFGSPEWGYGKDFEHNEALRITERALDLGINLIDTAEVYGFGRSERAIGKAIRGRRDQAFIASKIMPALPFDPVVHRRAAGSARRLGVDRIDLYQAHWPNPVFPPAPLFRALSRLQREGLVAHVGVSNYSLSQWQSAERSLGGTVLSNQVQYSLVDRRPEKDLVPWAQEHDRLVIAYSPLGQGLLSGRYTRDHRPTGVRSMRPLFLPSNLDRARDLIETLGRLADAHGATPSQVALAWLIRQPNVVVIPGASSVGQLESNVAAADLELTEDEAASLSEASDRFRPTAGLAAVPALIRAQLPV
ncbi:MAG TPA: aldo/keto reductase [Acidimicrobiales bacterium]|nr:aldo/keto reductase [Acidimicrobiales bacterium]